MLDCLFCYKYNKTKYICIQVMHIKTESITIMRNDSFLTRQLLFGEL